jgi:hypothetical protein
MTWLRAELFHTGLRGTHGGVLVRSQPNRLPKRRRQSMGMGLSFVSLDCVGEGGRWARVLATVCIVLQLAHSSRKTRRQPQMP